METKNAQKYRGKTVPQTVVENNVREALAECTVSWTNLDFEGEKLPCNKENALKIYTKRAWIAEQVIEEVADRANYDTKSLSS